MSTNGHTGIDAAESDERPERGTYLRLARHAADHLSTASHTEPELVKFVQDLRALPGNLPRTGTTSGSVRALRYLAQAFDQDPRMADSPLIETARTAVGRAAWSEFYAETAWSRPFIDRFATGDLVGPEATWRHPSIILGLFLFGPEIDYPAHAHPAEEVYLLLTGNASFQVGADTAYERKGPSDVVLHRSDVSHAIRTNGSPVIGIYMWRGDIAAPSWYRVPMSDPAAEVQYPEIVR